MLLQVLEIPLTALEVLVVFNLMIIVHELGHFLAAKWRGTQRIFLWQSLTDPPNQLPRLPGPVYILVKNGGKEIVSNQHNR